MSKTKLIGFYIYIQFGKIFLFIILYKITISIVIKQKMQYNKINKKGSDCMHQCVGNDDLENKKIYEESLRPEGIRKTVQIKESAFKFENRNIVHSPTKIKQKIHRNTNNRNRRAEKTAKIAAIATILSILFSIIEAIFG